MNDVTYITLIVIGYLVYLTIPIITICNYWQTSKNYIGLTYVTIIVFWGLLSNILLISITLRGD